MNENFTSEQIRELQEELENAKRELEAARLHPYTIQSNANDKFIETLFDKGGDIFKEYTKSNNEANKHSIDQETEIIKEELKIVSKLDFRDKLFKGVLISICIAAIVAASLYIAKADSIIPVISLIIGLLFKSNTLSDFYSHSKATRKQTFDEE